MAWTGGSFGRPGGAEVCSVATEMLFTLKDSSVIA